MSNEIKAQSEKLNNQELDAVLLRINFYDMVTRLDELEEQFNDLVLDFQKVLDLMKKEKAKLWRLGLILLSLNELLMEDI